MYIKLDKEYEVGTTLGVIKDIERKFGKSFYELVGNLATTSVEDQIQMLYCGFKRGNADIGEKVFGQLVEDSLGQYELVSVLQKFVMALQFPGLTQSQVQELIKKKTEEMTDSK